MPILRQLCVALAALVTLSPVYALEITSTNVEISSNQSQVSYQIRNNAKESKNYSVNVIKTTFPDTQSKTLTLPSGEIRVTPQTFQINAGQLTNLNIRYHGPQDNQERYYRLQITEHAAPAPKSKEKRSANISINSKIDAILVVRPRQQKLDYTFKKNSIKNTGNGYLVVLVDEQCGKVFKATHYLAPGSTYQLPAITSTSKVSLAVDNELKELVNKCKK